MKQFTKLLALVTFFLTVCFAGYSSSQHAYVKTVKYTHRVLPQNINDNAGAERVRMEEEPHATPSKQTDEYNEKRNTLSPGYYIIQHVNDNGNVEQEVLHITE